MTTYGQAWIFCRVSRNKVIVVGWICGVNREALHKQRYAYEKWYNEHHPRSKFGWICKDCKKVGNKWDIGGKLSDGWYSYGEEARLTAKHLPLMTRIVNQNGYYSIPSQRGENGKYVTPTNPPRKK